MAAEEVNLNQFFALASHSLDEVTKRDQFVMKLDSSNSDQICKNMMHDDALKWADSGTQRQMRRRRLCRAVRLLVAYDSYVTWQPAKHDIETLAVESTRNVVVLYKPNNGRTL
ncbi:hypothetical protein TNCV_4816471 [Trichonephila clavipes]|nr:hypothetical protein TNCV_4816471 [Trichonephila clavipes]